MTTGTGQAHKGPIRRQLFWQLPLAFSVLVFVFCVVFTTVTLSTLRKLVDRTLELENWQVAAELARDLEPYTQDNIDYAGFREHFSVFQRYSPQYRVFFVNADGSANPLFNGTPASSRETVFDTKRIEAALADSSPDQELYTLSYQRHHAVPFSVARMKIGQENGYLLILLRLSDFDPIASLLFEQTGLRLSLVTLGLLALSSVTLSFWIFRVLTRNFYQLLGAVRAYGSGDFSTRVRIERENEIGALSSAVNDMADRILLNINQLKRKDEIRKELIANVAHDLRAPATGILALADTLLLSNASLTEAEMKKCLVGIVESGESLEQMISELFELSRLESGERTASIRSIPPEEILRSASSRFRGLAAKRGVLFEEAFLESLPAVDCDPVLIGRALDNLLGNALKFTAPGGTISLLAKLEVERVQISVQDTGSGIREEDLAKIFERFHQVNRDQGASDLGLGLGLAIVSQVMRLHGLEISVSSELGKGSVFSFSLPLAAPESEKDSERR